MTEAGDRENDPVNALIEDSMQLASENHRQSLLNFFNGFLEGPVYIINRAQTHNLSHQPEYPNDLFNVLGVQDKDRTVVPVFSDPRYIGEWSGKDLFYRSFKGSALIDLLPESWWICINPGNEIEKEISPWEMAQLKKGTPGIEDILEELQSQGELAEVIDLREPSAEEYAELRETLTETAKKQGQISRLYMLIEKSVNTEGKESEKIIIGLECDAKFSGHLEKMKTEIEEICDLKLVGDLESKILAGISGSNILLGMFKDTEPFFDSKRSKI